MSLLLRKTFGTKVLYCLAKLNCDEFAMGSSNETSFYGNVQNPIDRWISTRRIIWWFCSSSFWSTYTNYNRYRYRWFYKTTSVIYRYIVGLKPTYGSCSRYGIVAFASSLDQAGPMAQNVEDCALLTRGY